MTERAFQIKATGLVQGVGFRPFVYRVACRLGLSGYVRNQRAGVSILVEGKKERLDRFLSLLKNEAPPASQIFNLTAKEVSPSGRRYFRIEKSRGWKKGELFVPPDIATCARCLDEMACRSDRRYLYPFINCTNCGPRYSIILDIPYDRSRTAMKEFTLCPDCLQEYRDPLNRRYHAEPIACPVCGPAVSLRKGGRTVASEDEAVRKAAEMLKKGKIIAVKGIAGFHLMCDATNEEAVMTLRKRKKRPFKPLALMAENPAIIRRYACLSPVAEKVLTGPARPILLLKKRCGKKNIAASVAPDNDYFGFFLAYAPLHSLLLKEKVPVLVATSANLSEEPIICEDREAEEKISGIADYFLVHDRKIVNRSDDSVLLPFTDDRRPVFIRRSRGFAPLPVLTRRRFLPSLAFGGEEKGTFAFASGKTVFPSPYLGDLKNYENLRFFEETLAGYRNFFRIKPEFLTADLHPDYNSRLSAERMSSEEKIPLFLVQHHKAHIASVIAEKDIKRQIIGCAFDGTGYGEDGTLWGGEFFRGDSKKMQRIGFLFPFFLPGGDQAVRHPWRTALSLLSSTFGHSIPEIPALDAVQEKEKNAIFRMLTGDYPFIKTSSAGRLFDGVSAILGLCLHQSYDAEAPVRLQDSAERAESLLPHLRPYPFALEDNEPLLIDWRPVIVEIVKELKMKKAKEVIAVRFHLTVAEIILQTCLRLSKKGKIKNLILSGGVFQNRLLLKISVRKLSAAGFNVILPEKLPVNDAGICLGQLLIAQAGLK